MDSTQDIINSLITKLYREDMWFTTKQDPTYQEAPSYYKLDKYGDLEEKEQEKIAKQIQNYIGDGAVDIEDAIELWMNEAAINNQIAYNDVLVTKFEPKQVVNQIDAYEVNLKENKEIKTELYDPIESKLPDLAREVQEFMYDFDTYDYNDNYIDDEEAFEDAMQALVHPVSREQTINKLKEIIKEDNEQSIKDKAQELINRINEFEKELEVYEESKKLKTESFKTRLKEENNKSQNLISQKFQDKSFDSDSKEGQIVMRTSELFNALSDKGFDVQVSFDNGESQSSILLGQQGGKVLITITDASQPLRAFSSGNYELTEDNIKLLDTIREQITAL